jgi:transposase
MIGRKMPHVVYRSFGVAGAALGAAKKIDLTKTQKRDWANCHRGGRPPKDDRPMVTGIWYVLRTGIPWRDLPPQFGPWSSVYTRFRRWCASGLWARLLAELGAGAYGEIRSVDCSHIKIHQDAANPAGGQTAQAMGRTKGGFNSKLAAVVDAVGRAVGLSLAPGPQHDLRACAPLMPHLDGKWVVGDKGFDSAAFRADLVRTGAMVCIPPRSTRRTDYYFSRLLYKHRHTVENFFCRIKRHRRIATRYEKLAVTFLGFVYLAAIIDWITHEV